MPRPKSELELKDQRIAVMFTKSELGMIDDWMFANRIRSRGEAIRQLCRTRILKDFGKTQDAMMRKYAMGDDDGE